MAKRRSPGPTHRRDENQRDHQHWEREQDIDDPHDHSSDRSGPEPPTTPRTTPDGCRQHDTAEAGRQHRPRAVDDTAEHVPAQLVGTEPVRSARWLQDRRARAIGL